MTAAITAQIEWNTGLRANLRLWPRVGPNIAAFANAAGEAYDQEAILQKYFGSESGKVARTTRAVREAQDAAAYAGLAYVDEKSRLICLTDFGASTFSFLGVIGQRPFANRGNWHLLLEEFILGYQCIRQYAAIWSLMARTNYQLTNDELNRAMLRITSFAAIPEVAEAVLRARASGNPEVDIGPRAYDARPGDEVAERTEGADRDEDDSRDEVDVSQMRKAMNPWFALAGAGGLIIPLAGRETERRMVVEARPIVERALSTPEVGLYNAASDARTAIAISRLSTVRRPRA